MYTLDFSEIKKEDVERAGGKGANLGEMIASAIPVPPGFVVTAGAYQRFLEENGLTERFRELIGRIDGEESVPATAEQMRSLIEEGSLPEEIRKEIAEHYEKLGKRARVAVRSSATAEDLPDASFAGQQETYLNISGLENVFTAVKRCYASLWGNRAVLYRMHQGYDQMSVSLAVVIQEMVESEISGVLFTADPVSRDRDRMLINAGYGLGESVVSGRITADTVVCDRKGKILSYEIGSKKTEILYNDDERIDYVSSEVNEKIASASSEADQSICDRKPTKEVPVSEERQKSRALTEDMVLRLAEEGRRIEEHYSVPMDIEWGIRGGRVYILQARAITTLNDPVEDPIDEQLIKNYIGDYRITGAMQSNMAFQLEKMPFAYRPFDYDLMITINDQKARIFAEAGILLNSDPRMDDDGIELMPENKKGIGKNIIHLPKVLSKVLDQGFCEGQLREQMPLLEEEVAAISKRDFGKMTLSECGEFLIYAKDLLERLCYTRFYYALFPSVLSGRKMTRVLRKLDPRYTHYDLLKDLDNKTSVITREVADLALLIRKDPALTEEILSGASYASVRDRLGACQKPFEDFFAENGFKSDFNCYCVIGRSFLEDPDRLLNILRPLLSSEVPDKDRADSEFDRMMAQLAEIYGKKYPALRVKIDQYRYFHVVREESQYLWETMYYYIRRCLERTNILLLGNEDYLHGVSNLFFAELTQACSRGKLDEKDLERIKRRNAKRPLADRVWEASKMLVFDQGGDLLKGVSGSVGTAVGKVCVIHSPAEFYKMQKGDILVCELTDPEWTPLFSLAAAVVADTGSALSHAAIVAREFQIPAVLGVGVATKQFRDGDMIRVDGTKGEVALVKGR